MVLQADTTGSYAASVMEAEWLTLDEACELLRVSRPTIYRFIKDKRLMPYELPGFRGMRFRKKDLDDMFRPQSPMAPLVTIIAKSSKPPKRRRTRT